MFDLIHFIIAIQKKHNSILYHDIKPKFYSSNWPVHCFFTATPSRLLTSY